MSRLHCLSHTDALTECLQSASPGDVLLLLGDGCYLALPSHAQHAQLRDAGIKLHVLQEDAQARGVDPASGIVPVDYPGFIELTVTCKTQHAWF